MRYFVIGDVHGCYYTLRELITKHWNREQERLILLGDLVNKGKHTFAVLDYVMDIQKRHPDQVVILKGNHDYLFEKNYRENITLAAKQKFEFYDLDYIEVLNWMNDLPHFYKTKNLFFSHAGVDVKSQSKLNSDNLDILFNKNKLKNIKKCQFLGHIVVDEPTYDKNAHAWYLDTGAGDGLKLTGAKIKNNGKIKEFISLDVNPKDICK
ncbi:hypothetical protein GO491_04970 [Flavobacteriaceae bacterium Ap0902]|nr:hypothetical protein [Flavobacteriaceae bacterium Ap0902]